MVYKTQIKIIRSIKNVWCNEKSSMVRTKEKENRFLRRGLMFKILLCFIGICLRVD